MEMDVKQEIEVIDLCTPNIDLKDSMMTSMSETHTLTRRTIIERFPNLEYRWSILACYPVNSKFEQGDPLLVNIARMSTRDRRVGF